jgi:thiosulfate dehydrogenase [quinone] large subunit
MWLAPPPRAQLLAGWAVVPLRVFLGVTFCYAGLQKIANPGFFDPTHPASIQAQLTGAARRSPIHALLIPLSHYPVLIGIVIALGELAVGIGTLLGLATRLAALGGLVISFGLFLAVSFHTSPYYTGSDIVFVFAWLPLLIVGGGQLSLDAFGRNLAAIRHGRPVHVAVSLPFSTVQQICGHYHAGLCAAQRNAPCKPAGCPYLAREAARAEAVPTVVDEQRRRLVGVAALGVGCLAVFGAGATAILGRLLHTSSASATTGLPAATTAPSPKPSPTQGGSTPAVPVQPPTAGATAPATPAPAGTPIGPAHDVPVHGAASFQDPASGDPAIVVQPRAGTFLAFDAVCPHAGCTVTYTDANFFCPCHGSRFDGTTGAVEVGPARQGLRKIAISAGPDGTLYVA